MTEESSPLVTRSVRLPAAPAVAVGVIGGVQSSRSSDRSPDYPTEVGVGVAARLTASCRCRCRRRCRGSRCRCRAVAVAVRHVRQGGPCAVRSSSRPLGAFVSSPGIGSPVAGLGASVGPAAGARRGCRRAARGGRGSARRDWPPAEPPGLPPPPPPPPLPPCRRRCRRRRRRRPTRATATVAEASWPDAALTGVPRRRRHRCQPTGGGRAAQLDVAAAGRDARGRGPDVERDDPDQGDEDDRCTGEQAAGGPDADDEAL